MQPRSSPPLSAVASLRADLLWLVAYRMAIAGILLTLRATVQVFFSPSAPEGLSLELTMVVAACFVSSLFYATLVWLGVVNRALAYVQIGTDLAVVTAVVVLTNGVTSPFVFLYSLAIISAAPILPRRATMSVAGFASLSLLVIGVLQPVTAGLATTLSTQVLAFMALGYLASALSNEVQRTRRRLRETEAELARVEDFHERVLLSLTSGIMTVNRAGFIVLANPAAERILAREQTTGRLLEDVAPELASLTPEQADRGETPLVTGSGRRLTVGISLVPLFSQRGEVLGRTLIFRDLTEIREMERRSQQSERLAAVGRLAASIAHEIRNPLGALSGSIELIAQSSETSDKHRELMAIVLREVGRLNQLITEFLAFARPHELELVTFDVALLVRETLAMIGRDPAFLGRRFESEGCDRALVGHIDPGQLRQVLWNLLKNAAEVTPTGGVVRVRARALGRELLMAVEDEGPGIADEHLTRIFEPFFTTRARGTGLGLALVEQLVRQHGGEVSAARRSSGGAVFEIRLPVLAVAGAATPAAKDSHG